MGLRRCWLQKWARWEKSTPIMGILRGLGSGEARILSSSGEQKESDEGRGPVFLPAPHRSFARHRNAPVEINANAGAGAWMPGAQSSTDDLPVFFWPGRTRRRSSLTIANRGEVRGVKFKDADFLMLGVQFHVCFFIFFFSSLLIFFLIFRVQSRERSCPRARFGKKLAELRAKSHLTRPFACGRIL